MNEVSISPEITAKILNKSVQFVRKGLQSGRLPFGTAVKTSSHWTYHISPKLLAEYIGEDNLKKYLERGDENVRKNQINTTNCGISSYDARG